MEWRLTFGGCLALLFAAAAVAQPGSSSPSDSGRVVARRTGTFHSVHWQRVALRNVVSRLQDVSNTVVFVDRRVDPAQRVTLSLQDASIDQIVDEIAEVCSLGATRIGGLIYLGPVAETTKLAKLSALRRQDVSKAPRELRRSFNRQQRIVWPRLTVPRDLVVKWAREQGLNVRSSQRIPHDLWAAGELPAMPVSDQLTLLLFGFDLTYRILPAESAIEIVPIGEIPETVSVAAAPTAERAAPRRRPPGAKRVFTLRVQEQPVGAVLEALARQLDWQITVDEEAIRRTGRSLDQRISFSVENVEVDELLNELLAPAGLNFQREGNRVRVGPK